MTERVLNDIEIRELAKGTLYLLDEVKDLRNEVKNAKELLFELTTLRDWMHEGYSIDEYNDFREYGKVPQRKEEVTE